MDKVEAYPWIGAIIGGLIGLLVVIIASNSISYFPYSLKGIDRGEVFWSGAGLGVIVAWIVVIVLSIEAGADEGIGVGIFTGVVGFFIGSIGGLIIGGIIGLIIVAIAPVVLGMVLGAITGIIVGIASGDIVNLNDLWDNDDVLFFLMPFSTVPGGILFGIAWGLESEFIANIIFVPMLGVVGYEIGKIISKEAIKREKRLEAAKGSMSLAKMKIKEAKMQGLDTSKVENIMKEISEPFRRRKYEIVKELAEKAKRPAEEYLEKRGGATAAIQKAREVVDGAKLFGCSVRHAEELLNKAISTVGSALERGSPEGLKEAERLANEAQEVAKRIKRESKPEIKIVLYPEEEFRLHSWQSVKLEVSNVGEAHAKDIEIHFSKEVEVKDLWGIGTLDRGKREPLRFMLKPLDMGKVPVNVTVEYVDFNGRSDSVTKRFYLNVSQEIPEVKVTIRDWEFIKDMIEEVTQSRVEVKELRRDLGRRYSDKDLARILEASKIMGKMVEMSYQRTIRTDDFLDTLRLLEGYTEGLSKRVTSEINKLRRFLREELFEYVDDEHKRDVRRFCRNLLDIWIAEVLKE